MPTVYDGPLPYDAPFPYENPMTATVLIQGKTTATHKGEVNKDAIVDI